MASSDKKRPGRTRRPTADPASLPDPRPVTDYSVALSTVGTNARITITLGQPCAIRQPAWAFVNVSTGARSYAASVTVVDNTTFFFDFSGLLPAKVAFVEVPYQDTQVQNSSGGFVSPGARWFRAA